MQTGTNYSSAVEFRDADNNWTAAEFSNTNKDNGALDAHWGAEKLTIIGQQSTPETVLMTQERPCYALQQQL
jgi:hypothetical protein